MVCGEMLHGFIGVNRYALSYHSHTVIITDNNQHIHHIRTSGMPEIIHQEIYKKLGVKDPLKRKQSIVGSRK